MNPEFYIKLYLAHSRNLRLIKMENTMPPEKNQLMHLQSAYLDGYRSIRELSIDFVPGLNVIVGKNAAGKTNFLTFLERVLNRDFTDLFQFNAKLVLENGNEVEILAGSRLHKIEGDDGENSISASETDLKIRVDNKEYVVGEQTSGNDANRILNLNLRFQCSLICHGLPKKGLDFVDRPLSFEIDRSGLMHDLLKYTLNPDVPYFIKAILASLLFRYSHPRDSGTMSNLAVSLKKELPTILESEIDAIRDPLIRYTPLTNVRLSKNFNIHFIAQKDEVVVSNLFLEFEIDKSWMPFSQLSDGTKRLVYIVSEVAFPSKWRFGNATISPSTNLSRIILIEEPELGVHPHQLQLLLDFLKIQSRDKQIIVTTHSPQVLDLIDENQLDRIIIADSDNAGHTGLKHLNTDQMAKARAYMQEEFLSDYWVHSNLENE